MLYRVRPVPRPPSIDGKWDKPFWSAIEPLRLSHYMGERPAHFPVVEAKLAHDTGALYVIFRVADQYVRAVAQAHQGPVWRDSCVEFFFTPCEDLATGYFNLEMNCGGTLLFHHQLIPWQEYVSVSPADLERIEVAHTLPQIVDPEIAAPTTWTVEYRLPLDSLGKYASSVRQPAPGTRWRANFYKCADDTSHPHWLTWSPVDHPKPDFHRPAHFGILEFC